MNLRFFDWIWHVKGSLPLAPGQTSDEAFARLDPLFREAGTSRERSGDSLTFRKRNQAAQDKMSVFDSGLLRIEQIAGARVLHYHMVSKALLFCFLAPLLFLAFAQLTIALGEAEQPAAAAKQAEKPRAAPTLHAIDKALGAPAPEMPTKVKDPAKKKHSPTSAYVFAGIFAALFLVGRFLEDRLARSLFRKRLNDA